MQLLFDFLQDINPKNSKICSYLKCDAEEILILQFMLKEYLNDQKEFEVSLLLKEIFNKKDSKELFIYLPKIKNLLESGWIIGEQYPINSLTLLEILHSEIALSPSFFKLFEEENLDYHYENESLEITPYDDHFEFLKDQFFRISLLQKLSEERLDSTPCVKTKYHLKNIEDKITARLKITKTAIPAHQIITENHLTSKEEIIFFALLKEEYTSSNSNLHDMNVLINLISNDEYDKIKNRALFDEKSPLIEKNILDYDELLNVFGGISRTFYIHEDVLQKIIHPKTKQKNKFSLHNLIKEQQLFEILEPKLSLDEIILPEKTKNTLETILQQADPKVAKLLKTWGIKEKTSIQSKIIFYGASGTGKTLSALGIAKSLKKQVLSLDCSKVLSQYVGESEKNVRKIFDNYKEITKKSKNHPILLLDEADQFLSLRINSGSGAEKMHNQMQNIFLEQIEKFEGILIATTNLLETIDNAFSRRFDHKIEFKRPAEKERILLWEYYLPKNATFKEHTKQSLAQTLAKYNLSGGQISLIVKNTAYNVALKTKPIFEEKDFIESIQKELRSDFDKEKNLGFNAF
ncbi:ATP-binding protein [Helicobacter sp. faydin-H20]|uniref:ATP-binding protein n=1 Tax=Helicobacter anatolicus TaxID=2905874 RepID=UPI001E608A4E|nr:ATP-binding protein [Helicobacter anatolicus]MCE3036897.1 ATP-binding protein [Helicobacter anatolicus]